MLVEEDLAHLPLHCSSKMSFIYLSGLLGEWSQPPIFCEASCIEHNTADPAFCERKCGLEASFSAPKYLLLCALASSIQDL